MAKNKAQVTIDGKPLTLVGSEPEEYIKKVASYIDEKLNEIRRSGFSTSLNSSMLSILTTINIADDFFKEREKYELMKEKLEMLQTKAESPSQVLTLEFDEARSKLEAEKTALEEEKAVLSEEISKLDAEKTALSEENAALNEKINKMGTEKETLFSGNNKLALENSGLAAQVKTFANENGHLRERIKKLEKTIIEKERSLIAGFQNEKIKYIKENQELQSRISELEKSGEEAELIAKLAPQAEELPEPDKPEENPEQKASEPSIMILAGPEEASGTDELSEKIKELEIEKAKLEAELSGYKTTKQGSGAKKYGASAYRNRKR